MNGYDVISTADHQILATYMRIGKGIIDNLETMTVGEREGLVKELQGMEEALACIGLKRLFEVEVTTP
jgi:hypothetical protein